MRGALRLWTSILVSIAAASSGAVLAQSEPAARQPAANATAAETPDEVIVSGRRVAQYRVEVQRARERAYAIFNEINSDNDFDVHCRDERKYFSRAERRVCRAQFEDRISGEAGGEYIRMLSWSCPAGANSQDCIFSPYGQTAANAARRVEGQLPGKREQMSDEILRLANENEEFAQAILDFYSASQRYDEARKGREE